tara:strand:- start:2982 stop:4241 length:1260 start_codon:yes stop_codon:yes gene_type:complete
MGRILVLKKAAYGSREEPPTMTRLMQGNYAGKPNACTICGNSPVVAGAQFRNRLGNINYTHHLCEPCADQYDIMHSADMYKGEPIDIAMRLLKNIDQEYLDYLDEQIYETSPYHSIRLQPSNYNSPHLARPLANYENLSFQQSFNDRGRGTKLPLTSHGRVLEGRHVYPAHAFSINPSLTGGAIADIPRSYMGEDYYDYPRPLNLFGFTGDKTPQRDDREARNIQSEGIIYGDIPEENVVQLTDNPFFYDNLRQASKSLLPTQNLQPSMLNERQQELARLLMEHEIPPVLMDEHIPTELIDDAEVVNNSRDTYRQWSPQRQLMDDMDLLFASEPMEIAMRLLKERVSPEAKRHKLEYDKKYESSPERVKYREELNRERRRRHIMGQGGPDMSHTSQHTIVPEDPHTNRARHFKDKGTLL